MAHGEDEQQSDDAPVGPRRSNYTPPAGGFRWFGRASGPSDDAVREGDAALDDESAPRDAAEPGAERLSEQLGDLTARLAAERTAAERPEAPSVGASPWAEPTTGVPVYPWDEPQAEAVPADPDRPWATSPGLPAAGPSTPSDPAPEDAEIVGDAEDPAPYVELTPTGSFVPPPARRSLRDDELAAAVGSPAEGGTLAAIERFEEQLRLREQDTAQFNAWERDVLAEGTTEAFDEVERVRGGFAGLVPPTTAAITLPVLPPAEADAQPGEEPPGEEASAGPESPTVEPDASPDDTPALVLHERLDWQDGPSPITVEGEIVPSEPVEGEIEPSEPLASEPAAELERVDPVAPMRVPIGIVHIDAAAADPEPEDQAEAVDDREPLPRPMDSAGAALDTAPISSVQAAQDIDELLQPEPARPLPLLGLEASGMQPTPQDQRAGRAIRLFWLWFAPQSSVLGLGVGALLLLGGLDLPQALLAAVAGSLLGLVPLSLGTLAAIRTGQPTIVASRAVFGVLGNALPAALALISRLLWGAVLLWVMGLGTSSVLVGEGLAGPLGAEQVSILAVAFAFLIALVIAFAGYGLLHGVHLVLSTLSVLLLGGMVALTWPLVDLQAALAQPQGSGAAVVSGTALVLSFTGLAWAFSGGDVARYQRPGGSGTGSVAATGLASVLPTVGLLGYGALLAASDPALAGGLAGNPAAALAELLPSWYAVPLVLALVGSLLAGVVLVLYSAAFSVQALGLDVQRQSAVVIVGLLLAISAVALILAVPDLRTSIDELVGTVAVPVAAWAGIFAGDLLLRGRALDTEDLLRSGGRYPAFVWGNLAALVVLTALGYGLRSSELGALSWQGYLAQPLGSLGLPVLDAFADGGVIVALLLGLAWSLATAGPRIRRQQAAAVDA
ncbi:cytosine permease [Arenivirga flava]|uniref:Cytosine permease n=1 Tax=Arenivirga flava TaxID=1930060 RepID=A0AA37XAU1_9MICO|nr:cytosine permease [Arenivirga flava]GMA27691.1 hypothetical protein GCM10025874_09440 [Arenivirga flava]